MHCPANRQRDLQISVQRDFQIFVVSWDNQKRPSFEEGFRKKVRKNYENCEGSRSVSVGHADIRHLIFLENSLHRRCPQIRTVQLYNLFNQKPLGTK